MSKYEIGTVDFDKQRSDIWEIFKDNPDIFSDLSCQIAGCSRIDTADKLFSLFHWTLSVSRSSDCIGIYKEEKLIGISYLTHIEPLDRYREVWEWEGSYHGAMLPEYRTPKHTNVLIPCTVQYLLNKHELNYLFSWSRVDNRLATLALLRNGFEHIDIMKRYRYHQGVPHDYNLFIYRG